MKQLSNLPNQNIINSSPESYFPRDTEVFFDVQNQVNNELIWQYAKSPDEQKRPANCLDFTYLASEKLSHKNTPHKIGCANGHFFIVGNVNAGDRIETWLIDSLSPKLSQNIDEALNVSATNDEKRDLAYFLPCKLKINHLPGGIHPHDMYPWLSLKGNFSKADNSSQIITKDRLILSMFEPELGKSVLKEFGKFHSGLNEANIAVASSAIIKMSGVFPDIDVRSCYPNNIKKLVKEVAHNGYVDTAEEVVEAFFDSFGPSQDSRVTEYRADCLRTIAKETGRKELAKRAIAMYRTALKSQKSSKDSINNKIAISQSIIF